MQIRDIAKELKLSDQEVLDKAVSMGISCDGADSEISDIDAKVVKNSIIHENDKKEIKVVRTRAKKSEAEKKEAPKVVVKAANIKLPEKKKTKTSKWLAEHCWM